MKQDIIKERLPLSDEEGPFFRRLAWFIALWGLSVSALATVAVLIKWAIA